MKKLLIAIFALAITTGAMAQKVADKELVGVWLMEYMQFDGENRIECGKNYTQIKYYGPDGEYACAEIVLTNDGEAQVLPHEYGTYTMKNGVYSEMGRPAVAPQDMVLDSPTQFHGRWHNRTDRWRKCTTMPKPVVGYIVGLCRAAQPQPEMNAQVKKCCFK